MALHGISNNEHSRLLWRISNLPYDEAQLLGNELTTVYNRYHTLLVELASTIEDYDQIVTKVKRRKIIKKPLLRNV